MFSAKADNNSVVVLSEEEKLNIKSTKRYMLDMLAMLAAPVVMAWYYYGQRALWLIVLSVITAVGCEFFGSKITKGTASINDLSAVVTGIMVALCMSAAAPWWFACVTSAVAIIVAKLPFGNARSVMFLPAAVGIAFMTICNTSAMFLYPAVSQTVNGADAIVSGNSIAGMLVDRNSIGINIISYIDILVGNVSGPMGATCGVVLMGALVYLLFRRPKTAVITVSYLVVCAIYAFLFPRITTGRMISVVMELSGGILFFCGLFFLTNETIAPKRLVARVCYGAVAGLAVMLLRTFGTFEDSTVFAVLLVNAISPVFDKQLPLTKKEKRILNKKMYETSLLEEQKKAQEQEAQRQEAQRQEMLLKAIEEEKARVKAEEEAKAQRVEVRHPTEEAQTDDDVPTLQDLSDIKVADDENGGDSDV